MTSLVTRLHDGRPPLAHAWKDFVYTDASYTPATPTHPARRGCGVYVPSASPPHHARVRFPYTSGAALRGEMLALRWAIEHARPASASPDAPHPVLRILSDCKGALDLIHSALHTPHEMVNHEHASLLADDVVRVIALRPCPVHLLRVSAATLASMATKWLTRSPRRPPTCWLRSRPPPPPPPRPPLPQQQRRRRRQRRHPAAVGARRRPLRT